VIVYRGISAQSHQEGYGFGYTDGVREGVNRGLSLTNKEAEEASQLAPQLLADGNVIDALNDLRDTKDDESDE
jgi:hypothetical protein